MTRQARVSRRTAGDCRLARCDAPHRASRSPSSLRSPLAASPRPLRARTRSASASPPLIVGHPIRVDDARSCLSWSRAGSPYAHVARLAWNALETRFPVQDNGLQTWLGVLALRSRRLPRASAGRTTRRGSTRCSPTPRCSGTRSAATRAAIDAGAQGARLPARPRHDARRTGTGRACPTRAPAPGDVDYRGADDEWCDFCGRGDGIGVIEPDKVGELGYAYLQMFELTGDAALPRRRRRVRRRAREARPRRRRDAARRGRSASTRRPTSCARSTRRT